jgi:hypothetical protein
VLPTNILLPNQIMTTLWRYHDLGTVDSHSGLLRIFQYETKWNDCQKGVVNANVCVADCRSSDYVPSDSDTISALILGTSTEQHNYDGSTRHYDFGSTNYRAHCSHVES